MIPTTHDEVAFLADELRALADQVPDETRDRLRRAATVLVDLQRLVDRSTGFEFAGGSAERIIRRSGAALLGRWYPRTSSGARFVCQTLDEALTWLQERGAVVA